ncbi:hypothetical protein N7448_004954 [Penicillium atrosanguineum]|nr:hypothetical protein N7448_004954 [Penicillium atrosanguineum]
MLRRYLRIDEILNTPQQHARDSTESKKREWTKKSQQHEELLRQAAQTPHQWEVDVHGIEYHPGSCQCCSIENHAKNISIDVYEWPLPKSEEILKTVIFELDCPHWFLKWRDVTWHLIHDFGRVQIEQGPNMQQNLLSYKETQQFCVSWGQRLTLGSTAKSWKRSHYSSRQFPVAFGDITPPNALRFRLLDSKDNSWVGDQNDYPSLKRWCIFNLPPGPYTCLQYTVDSFLHSENKVIADQQNCPSELSLHEFIAFGCLRAGSRVQWYNMVRELASSSLAMNEEAICMLYRQAAWELSGPSPGSELREAHVAFAQGGLGSRLLECLDQKLGCIEANWNEHHTLHTLVVLGLRTLSLSDEFSIVERAVALLRRSRKTALKWCENLTANLSTQTDAQSEAQQLLIVKIGGLCQLTYAVEPQHLPLLLDNRADLFHLTRSSILVFENSPRSHVNIPSGVKNSLIWTTKTLHNIEEHTRHLIETDASGFNEAINKSVHDLQIASAWRSCPGNASRWVINETSADTHGSPQKIHYNLLSGELLLANCPPGRLPREYTILPLFQRIFGNRTLTVLPSNLNESIFMSTAQYEGYSLHFSVDAGELIIKARAERQILQLIPHEKLAGDFPETLVSGYVHWLALESGTLEFRPLEHAWAPQSTEWHLSIDSIPGKISSMTSGHQTLVDINSQLFKRVAGILGVLDAPSHIHVVQTRKEDDKTVEIHLVRLRLKFFINQDGDLESQEFNAKVDQNQDIGCLYGLKNKLVLLDSGRRCRSVLIPYGGVQLFKVKRQTVVTVTPPEEPRLRCFHYSFDHHLKVLQGSFDMLEILYLAYMHAVTSYILPDPATERSGTAEAIRILRQACLKTSFPLSCETIALLKNIAALTPRRRYYPDHVKSMQTVSWNSELGELAQHDDFRALTQEIVEHASILSTLHGLSDIECDTMANCYKDRGDIHLLERARSRNSQFFYSELGGGSVHRLPRPSLYRSRDREFQSERSHRVYKIATLVRSWRPCLSHCVELLGSVGSWKSVRPSGPSLKEASCTELLRLSFRDAWGSLYELCRSSDQARDSYSLMSLFCTIAFSGKEEKHIYSLLAVAFSTQFEDLPIPPSEQQILNLQLGECFDEEMIKGAIERNYSQLLHPGVGTNSKAQKRAAKERKARYDLQKENDLKTSSEAVKRQWPCEMPQLPEIERVNKMGASQACSFLCTQWYQNRQFLTFLRSVQEKLNTMEVERPLTDLAVPPTPPRDSFVPSRPFLPPSLFDILSSSSPTSLPTESHPLIFHRHCIPQRYNSDINTELRSLISDFRNNVNTCQRELGEGLEESLDSLEKADLPCSSLSLPVDRNVIVGYCDFQRKQKDAIWNAIEETLNWTEHSWEEVAGTILMTQITSHSILSLLATERWHLVPEAWKNNILMFARSISFLRRADRLLSCYDRNDIDGFFKEVESVSEEGWEALEYPGWLLFEIENNLTIRKSQTDVALNIISPTPQSNSVMQLNMGEGKTSVITPLAASVLADGENLLRIFVLKPLLRQSVNLLSQRLGGMLGRRIYHIPFARDTPLDKNTLDQLHQTYVECQRQKGILIVLPEQVLSFRLVGLDLMNRDPALAPQAIGLERWLQSNCRNVIDESDEVLDPKFQLVYTVGSQQTVDGHSDRWDIIQSLLSLVDSQVEKIRLEDPNCLDIERSGARYPILHFLRPETADTIISKILDVINEEGLPGLPMNQWAGRVRRSALDFIRFIDTTNGCRNILRETFQDGIFLRKLLVLRGLLAHDILKFTLAGKRWLVDYGLHTSRCLMAVPFRAKGIPSENAEFGHPDVAITLTCLSYYYHGLTVEQVRHCFTLLGKENDPSAQYHDWISNGLTTLPLALRAITGVNLEDTQVFCGTLYPHLRYQKCIIDFYLSQVVFPKEAKEFPQKLCASAWDIPSQKDQPLTTGFSGTNDNRLLLPRSTPQCDLPHLLHTNAMVISCLLREENRSCILAQDRGGRQLSTMHLIALIKTQCPSVRVIIDVGAQILESSNRWVATHWLSIADDADGAIFFDENDEPAVVDREGHVERLLCSPFRQRMHRCLVFLDQQHARGVDLKLPSTYRAAVTIGPRLTKDRLVQACGRLRGLGVGQSVVFLIPPEVSHSMRRGNDLVTSLDVIRWALMQTCDTLQSLKPLWASQGLQHYKKNRLWSSLIEDSTRAQDVVSCIQEPEAQTLSQLYDPSDVPRASSLNEYIDPSDLTVRELLTARSSATSGHAGGPTLHEEQERQITHEVQRERQVCRPPKQTPLLHHVHEDIRHFVKHGKVPDKGTTAACLAFDGLRKTSAGQFNLPQSLGSRLYTSDDFVKTVKRAKNTADDQFLKPVHWILSNIHNHDLLLLSQHEVNELLPDIRMSKQASLHVYSPKRSKTMRSFNDLAFLVVGERRNEWHWPPELIQDLALFSGNLYFKTFLAYENFRHFLGLVTGSCSNIPEGRVTNEGFVDEETRRLVGWPTQSPFMCSPLPFLRALFNLRSKGHGFSQTHIGMILDVRVPTANQF